jgi:hypothetical protein
VTASIVLILVAILALGIYVCHKIRRVHSKTFEILSHMQIQSDNLFQQIQSLVTLQNRLQLSAALPPLRGWNASPDFLMILMNYALEKKPRVIVECGSGASTIVLARCSQISGCGHVYSLEHDAVFAEKTRSRLITAGLADWVTVLNAPLTPHAITGDIWPWYSLEGVPDCIDLLVVDGPPMPLGEMIRYPAGPLLLHRLNETGAVFLDDTKRADEKAILERWISERGNFMIEEFETEKGCVALHAAAPK